MKPSDQVTPERRQPNPKGSLRRMVGRWLARWRTPEPTEPPPEYWIERNAEGRYRYAAGGPPWGYLLGEPRKTWGAACRDAWKQYRELEDYSRRSRFERVQAPNYKMSH